MRHDFHTRVTWTGDRGTGTRRYRGYDRSWEMEGANQPAIQCSNDPRLGGNPRLPNPEELLLAAVSSCHMLWFLHYASDAGILVRSYVDEPVGHGESESSGSGRFLAATLRPSIRRVEGNFDSTELDAIHARIHEVCFCARSVNFEVHVKATYDRWEPAQ